MSGYQDLDEFYDGALRLPWKGTEYVIPAPDWQLGLKCQALVSVGVSALAGADEIPDDTVEVLSDDSEESIIAELLGPVQDQLREDGASWPIVRKFGITALMHFTMGEAAGQAVWTGKAPEPPAAPNREQRRAQAKGGGRSTTSQGSTGGKTPQAGRRKS